VVAQVFPGLQLRYANGAQFTCCTGHFFLVSSQEQRRIATKVKEELQGHVSAGRVKYEGARIQKGEDTGRVFVTLWIPHLPFCPVANPVCCLLGKTVSTAIVAASPFYVAQTDHQDYLNKNPGGYCNHRMRFKAWPK